MGRLFTFVISLVVVGAVLFLATRIAIGPAPEPDKPATPVARRVGAHGRVAESDVPWGPVTEVERVPLWRRVRSGRCCLAAWLTASGPDRRLLSDGYVGLGDDFAFHFAVDRRLGIKMKFPVDFRARAQVCT